MPTIKADPTTTEDFENNIKGLTTIKEGNAIRKAETTNIKDKLINNKSRAELDHQTEPISGKMSPSLVNNDQGSFLNKSRAGYNPRTKSEVNVRQTSELHRPTLSERDREVTLDNTNEEYPIQLDLNFYPRLPNGDKKMRYTVFSEECCGSPCACCGARDHPIVSPNRAPEGMSLTCDFICPVALCDNWQEQRVKRDLTRLQPCPRKLAAMCNHDAKKANEALEHYEQLGSGQYRQLSDRTKFRADVLELCGPSATKSATIQKKHAEEGKSRRKGSIDAVSATKVPNTVTTPVKSRDDKKPNSFSRTHCEAPCACCGAKGHAMLSPNKTSEGTPINCDYICPVAICDNWQEQRVKCNAKRYQPCPKKFVVMCQYDIWKAHKALKDVEKLGWGRYRKASDRATFRTDVLALCNVSAIRSTIPQKVQATGFSKGIEETNCQRVTIKTVSTATNLKEKDKQASRKLSQRTNNINTEKINSDEESGEVKAKLSHDSRFHERATSVDNWSTIEANITTLDDRSKILRVAQIDEKLMTSKQSLKVDKYIAVIKHRLQRENETATNPERIGEKLYIYKTVDNSISQLFSRKRIT